MESTSVEPKTTQTPILNIAWKRQAQLNIASSNRTSAFYRIRGWIILLGVLATLLAILTQQNLIKSSAVTSLVVKIFLVATPVVASILAAFTSKFYANGAWLILRAGSEEIKKEVFFYRTILQNNSDRRVYMEKRLAQIQRGLYNSLGGDFAFEEYDGPLPRSYNPKDPNSDSGFKDLSGEEYFKYRLEHQLKWHNKKVNQYKLQRRQMTIYILLAGGLGAVMAAWGVAEFSLWVAFTASITAGLIGWQELRNLDEIIKNYSKVVMELTLLSDHWQNLEPEERTDAEFYQIVRSCEDVLWAQNNEYIRSMREVLKENTLEGEASLINRVIKESVESAEQSKQPMQDRMVNFTDEVLQGAQQKIDETFQGVLGSLAEEASSDLVQQELEAMGRAIEERAENFMERASGFSAALMQSAQDYSHVDIGRNTPTEELNAILVSLPKTNEVKG